MPSVKINTARPANQGVRLRLRRAKRKSASRASMTTNLTPTAGQAWRHSTPNPKSSTRNAPTPVSISLANHLFRRSINASSSLAFGHGPVDCVEHGVGAGSPVGDAGEAQLRGDFVAH